MKIKFLILPILVILISCGGDSEKEKPIEEANISILDFTSVESFIQSFTQVRKEANSEIENYEISIEQLIPNPECFILKCLEIVEGERNPYVIMINPKNKFEDSPEVVNGHVNAILDGQNFEYNLLIGFLEETIDFKNDGSSDFILNEYSEYGWGITQKATLFLFDGKSDLIRTNVIANTQYRDADCGLIGVIEELIVDTNSHDVTIRREEYISPKEDCKTEELIELRYDKVWRWINTKFEDKYRFNTPQLNASSILKKVLKEFTYLQEEEGDYIVKDYIVRENCTDAHGNSYELIPIQPTDATEHYILNNTGSDEGYSFLAGVKQEDSLTIALYWRDKQRRGAGTDFNSIEESGKLEVVRIRKDTSTSDRYWFCMYGEEFDFLTTIKPDNYRYVECDESDFNTGDY